MKPTKRAKNTTKHTFRDKEFYTNWMKNHKLLVGIAVTVGLVVLVSFLIARWYIVRHRDEPLKFGVSYISNYAEYLGLDPKETFYALRDDLGFDRFRLVSYWKDIEKERGTYDFTDLDWQFDAVEEVGGEVTLAIGLRQPRWPECHAPEWHHDQSVDVWYPELKEFMTAVINRYKDRPSLVSYQLENEFFLSVFGECTQFGFDRWRLEDEFAHVKSLDPDTPIILSLANNYFGVPTGSPRADIFGVSVYKRVYDYTVTKRYLEYPFPPWYYSFRAGVTEILTGRKSMLHELQAEPWTPVGMVDAPIEEQERSMNVDRLRDRFKYADDTGFREADLWGGEWWYWRKKAFNDPSLWETVREQMQRYNQ
jgi:hypothetical protein